MIYKILEEILKLMVTLGKILINDNRISEANSYNYWFNGYRFEFNKRYR